MEEGGGHLSVIGNTINSAWNVGASLPWLVIVVNGLLVAVITMCVFFSKLRPFMSSHQKIEKFVESLKNEMLEVDIDLTAAKGAQAGTSGSLQARVQVEDLWTIYKKNRGVKRLVQVMALRKAFDEVEHVLERDVGQAGVIIFVCVGLYATYVAANAPTPEIGLAVQFFTNTKPAMLIEVLFIVYAALRLLAMSRGIKEFEHWEKEN